MAGLDGNTTVTDQGTTGGGSFFFLFFRRQRLLQHHFHTPLGRGGQRQKPHQHENQPYPQTRPNSRNTSHQFSPFLFPQFAPAFL